MTRRSALIGAGALALCAVCRPGDWALVWGLLLGLVFSLARFRLSCAHLVAFAHQPPAQAHGYLVRRRFAVYGLTAAVLAVAFWRRDLFNPWAAVAGVFLTSAVVIADTILRRRSAPAPLGPGEET